MDPNKVKLTPRQMVKPTLASLKHPFVMVLAIAFSIFLFILFFASQMNVIVQSNVFLNFIATFGLSVGAILFCALPFILFIAWWESDDDAGGKEMRRFFIQHRREVFLDAKKEVLENVIDDEVLRK